VRQYGHDAKSYWIYEPADPKPASAPVIIFLHGWSAMKPRPYEAWIDHIVRRGNIVIYPRYQDDLLTPLRSFMPNATAAIKSALRELQTGDHVRPDLDRVAMVGHSMGGAMTANLAAVAGREGLPVPKAIMPVEPGSHNKNHQFPQMPLENFSKIPAETLMILVTGDNDRQAGDVDARIIFCGTPQVPATNKNYVVLITDRHGEPALRASHYAPLAARNPPPFDQRGVAELRDDDGRGGINFWRADALDFYGTWKLFDALTDAAFYGTNREFALGNTPQQRFMGKWSDGTPVKELEVINHP
jgi:acetyl esterase/lipase